MELYGKPILVYTLERFQYHIEVDGIILVCISEWIEYAKTLIEKYQLDKVMAVVEGGKTGQESIYGVISPIIVKEVGDRYVIIAGERRWRAAKLAGLKEVPVIVKEFTEQEAVEIALIENIQRENLNPIEEALAYKRLLTEFNLKQDEVAERVSKSRTAVTNSMRLLKLDEKIQQMVVDEMISTGHARALLAIEDKEEQLTLASRIFDEKLSVRDVENIIRLMKNPKPKKEKPVLVNDFIYRDLEEKMKSVIGTKVSINQKTKNKGKIEIEYYSNEELEHIFDLLMSINNN